MVIDDVDYLDGKTIKTKEFYHILDDTSRNVRTYHINPAMFEDAFRPYAERGDSVLYLCFSTGIAGTFNAANIARTNILEDHPDFDLTIFDTKCASAGFGLLVRKLLIMQEHGASKELLLEAAEFYRAHIHHVVTVNTLAYLIKGGRLSKFKGNIAETLDMKPILIIDAKRFPAGAENRAGPQEIPENPGGTMPPSTARSRKSSCFPSATARMRRPFIRLRKWFRNVSIPLRS